MATLVLGTVGRIFGGPIGGILGTLAGGAVDRSLFGGGRNGGRLGNLVVQSAAYGEPIPVISGRMRAAGNLIWSSGIVEQRSGGGKRGGAGYSYRASFAVALAAGPISDVGRIWADGTEIRNAAGSFAAPVTMRLYTGDEGQAVDPLIASAEGVGNAPAYRGIAYAVFADLPLADYGNRIPNLTFEIIADAGAIDIGTAIVALARADGTVMAGVAGGFAAIDGHVALRAGSIADAIAPLVEISGAVVIGSEGLVIRGDVDSNVIVAARDAQAHRPDDENGRDRQTMGGGETRIDAIELGYYDTGRDYQPSLQRVRRGGGSLAYRSIGSALPAIGAKQLAAAVLARGEAARRASSARLPWRHVGIRPGMQLRFDDEAVLWRVRTTRFEGFVVHLELEASDLAILPSRAADAGRAVTAASLPAGATTLQWLDLPPLPGETPVTPRLWLAAAGAAPGWRRAPVSVSSDGGFSYALAGTVEGGAVLGTALTPLPAGSTASWDDFATVDIELLSDVMWLQSISPAAVLAGGNLALIGEELVQFRSAEALAPRRFRLSGLLRGRQGSEAAVNVHGGGERFVLLDRSTLLAVDPAPDAIGRLLRARAEGNGDNSEAVVAITPRGRALQPLAPAHLQLERSGGDVIARWIRRSRAGFGWSDFIEAPLAEAEERYRVEVRLGGIPVRTVSVAAPAFVYVAADRSADGGGTLVTIAVQQVSALVGPGSMAEASLDLGG